jgi:hypothetical protein
MKIRIDPLLGNIDPMCHDLNGNGICDPNEDFDRNGVCNIMDCAQSIMIRHLNATCWDNGNGVCELATEDLNKDGKCDILDCPIANLMRTLLLGISETCWDTDQDGLCDNGEDINGDGICNLLDCIASNGNLTGTPLNTPNTLVSRNGAGSFAAQDVTADGTVFSDTVSSSTANTDLTLEGDGTGNVVVSDTLKADTITSKTNLGSISISGQGLASTVSLAGGTTILSSIFNSMSSPLRLSSSLQVDSIAPNTLGQPVTISGDLSIVFGQILTTDAITTNTNADLIIDADGTGNVQIADVLEVNVITAQTANTALSLQGTGTGTVTSLSTFLTNTINGRTTDLSLAGASGTGNVIIAATNILKTDQLTSTTTNTDLSISGSGTGNVVIANGETLKTNTLTSTTNNADIVISGAGTGSVAISDALKVDSIGVNAAGAVAVTNTLQVNSIVARTTNTDLSLSGAGTGGVSIVGILKADNILSSTSLTLTSTGVGSRVIATTVFEAQGGIVTSTISNLGSLSLNGLITLPLFGAITATQSIQLDPALTVYSDFFAGTPGGTDVTITAPSGSVKTYGLGLQINDVIVHPYLHIGHTASQSGEQGDAFIFTAFANYQIIAISVIIGAHASSTCAMTIVKCPSGTAIASCTTTMSGSIDVSTITVNTPTSGVLSLTAANTQLASTDSLAVHFAAATTGLLNFHVDVWLKSI